MFIFSQWSQNLAKIVSKDCYTSYMNNFSFSELIRIRFLKLGYSNNKHKDTVYVLFKDRVTSVKEWFSKEFSEGYRTLISAIIDLHPCLKSHYSTDALHTTWLLQKWNVTSTKYDKQWTLIIFFNPSWEQKVKEFTSIPLKASENIFVCLNSHSIRSINLEATPYTRKKI